MGTHRLSQLTQIDRDDGRADLKFFIGVDETRREDTWDRISIEGSWERAPAPGIVARELIIA